jgi:hypothetical protein
MQSAPTRGTRPAGRRWQNNSGGPTRPGPSLRANTGQLWLNVGYLFHYALLTLANRGVLLGLLITSSMPACCFCPNTEEHK